MKKPSARSHKKHTSNRSDQKLLHCIQTHGAGLHLCGKSCRVRRSNDVRPDLKKGNFGEDEEDLIIRLHALLGNRWSLIAGRLPGRTDVEVQNYWNSHMTRKLMNMGIDPQNHHVHQIQTIHYRQHRVHRSKSKTINTDKATATSDGDDEPAEVSDAGSVC